MHLLKQDFIEGIAWSCSDFKHTAVKRRYSCSYTVMDYLLYAANPIIEKDIIFLVILFAGLFKVCISFCFGSEYHVPNGIFT